LGVFLGAAAALSKLSWAGFFVRLCSPLVILLLILWALIYFPATLRIYYILLLDAKGVFTAIERQCYQERKKFWEEMLLKGALFAGVGLAGLGVFLFWARLSH
jgi:hypothetical protein